MKYANAHAALDDSQSIIVGEEHYQIGFADGFVAARQRDIQQKRWECRDCKLGADEGPCTAPFDCEDSSPTECPYGNGADCRWVLCDL